MQPTEIISCNVMMGMNVMVLNTLANGPAAGLTEEGPNVPETLL